jgi:hypothetical protein
LSDIELQSLFEELDEFIRAFRSGEKVTEPKSESDRDLISQFSFNMTAYEGFKRGYLQIANDLAKPSFQRDGAKQVAKSYALRFRTSIDQAKAYGLIHDGENITAKLKETIDNNVELQRRLQNAEAEIERLSNILRLHGLDPKKQDDTFFGGVEEGGDSHE